MGEAIQDGESLRKQLQKGKEKGSSYYIATTKSGKVRTITAAPYVMNLLKEQLAQQRKEHLELGFAWQNEQNLGHATASFTLDVYGHVSEKMKQDSAARMERFISKVKA